MCQESYLSLSRFLHTYYTQNPVTPRRRSRLCKFALKPSAPTPSEGNVCSFVGVLYLSHYLFATIKPYHSLISLILFGCAGIVEWLWSLKFPRAKELLDEIRTTFWGIFKGGPRFFFHKCPYRSSSLSPSRENFPMHRDKYCGDYG